MSLLPFPFLGYLAPPRAIGANLHGAPDPSMPSEHPKDAAILTYDLGTTRLKVALFDLRGRLLAQRAARHVEHRHDDRAWQDADAWWSDAVRLTHELLGAKPRSVVALSVSGRGGAAIFVGRDGTVIGQPWSDRRHADELKRLTEWRAHGAHVSNYAAALLAKKQWFVANEPARARQLRHAMYAKDFLIYRLTGECVTDPISGPDAPTWDERALDYATSHGLVPRVAQPWDWAGPLHARAAAALGLSSGIPVAVGAHDGICANVGAGAAFVGAYAITVGTHAVVRAIRPDVPPGAFRFYDLPPGRHVIGGNAVMGGRAADWFLDVLFGADDRVRPRHFATLDTAAAAVHAGSNGVRFLPFLLGQVAPESRPGASAVFTGMRTGHDRATLYRAVLEGGAFAIRAIFDQILAWCGEPTIIRLTGGGAHSAIWCEILANVLARPLEASDKAVEGRGAAIFAAVALGLFPDYDAAGRAWVPIKQRYEPQPAQIETYEKLYRDWQTVSDATRPLDRRTPVNFAL
jgi:sugar (pentulose or hexulose) kinase